MYKSSVLCQWPISGRLCRYCTVSRSSGESNECSYQAIPESSETMDGRRRYPGTVFEYDDLKSHLENQWAFFSQSASEGGTKGGALLLDSCGSPDPFVMELQSCRPSKEVPKPRPGKVPKKCFGKCRSETGCFGKCRKKCSGSRLLYYLYIGAEPGALFSAPSSAPRFGPALSEALFRHFSWPWLRHFCRWPPGL